MQETPQSAIPKPVDAMERHYTVDEIAEAWHLSRDTVRRIFEREPGVLVIENHPVYAKRRYRTLRIPASAVERVHRRLLTKGLSGGELRARRDEKENRADGAAARRRRWCLDES